MTDWTAIIETLPRWMVASVLWMLVIFGAAHLVMDAIRLSMKVLLWIRRR